MALARVPLVAGGLFYLIGVVIDEWLGVAPGRAGWAALWIACGALSAWLERTQHRADHGLKD